MASGDWIGGLILIATGVGIVYFGHRVRVNERADLIFAPNTTAPKTHIARVGGRTTILGGIATAGLGLTLFVVPPTGEGWAILVSSYTLICVAIGARSWWRIRRAPE